MFAHDNKITSTMHIANEVILQFVHSTAQFAC